LTDRTDLTKSGEKALGVIFRRHCGKRIEAKCNGAPTLGDWSDISIEDK
jgi:hypothetical protein